MKINLLIKKYIKNDAKFQINIPSKMYRSLINNKGKQLNVNEQYTIFDDIIIEMQKLLKQSMNRFSKTKDYERLLTKL